MPKGVYDRSKMKRSTVPQNREGKAFWSLQRLEDTDEKREALSKIQSNLLVFYEMGSRKVVTDAELQERIVEFFCKCAETQTSPTVEKLAVAIGYSRQALFAWGDGKPSQLGRNTQEIVNRAKDFMAAYDAELVVEGKMNPVAYIFRAKNFHGMVDKQEHVVTPGNSLGNEIDPKVVEESLPELEDGE